jgi:hypothetical protein
MQSESGSNSSRELVLVGDYDGGVVLFEVAERFRVEVFVVVGLGLRLVV